MSLDTAAAATAHPSDAHKILIAEAKLRPPPEAAEMLAAHPPELIAAALLELNPGFRQDILQELPDPLLGTILRAVPSELGAQWERNARFEKDAVGRFMEPVYAGFTTDMTVGETIEQLRSLVKRTLVTYVYVIDDEGKLRGVVTMRDLLFADEAQRLADVMLREVFTLPPEMRLNDAMKLVLDRHYPIYPVCDASGRLVGQVRGQAMFEEQAIEITAQVGTTFGVDKEERLATPIGQSFKYRHPWLQLNLATAFVAGAVVAIFQDTVDRLVVLALFLPVLAGQSGNTGCQALAVTLRGMTLGEVKAGRGHSLVTKEAWLGFYNGALTGLVAAAGMLAVALYQGYPNAVVLAVVVWMALVGACIVSGICGALIPLTLKRFGLDPATASSIFLTTATDVVSMGMLLGLATMLVH
ncbi:MAG: magnesium transporter [Betaproteobacteria bacterium]|nr:MAG: magnesium transporter [Betaproteobacteria bacterium]